MNKYITIKDVTIDMGFWRARQDLNILSTIPAVYDRFKETNRFACIASRLKAPFVKSHIFYDSDTAKWIESVAFVLQKDRENHSDLEKKADEIIAKFVALQNHRGYMNSYYQRHLRIKFGNRDHHELYCCGHLAEAAIAYYEATGKSDLLNAVDKYIDYIIKRFVTKHNASFTTPGHEEIELALFKLYEATGKEKYKDLAVFFLENRGMRIEHSPRFANSGYDQHHKPIREQTDAIGHAVRALYLYSGMADMARLNGDTALYKTCRTLWEDVSKKMYVTGGVGSTHVGEAITIPYDLPNLTAYSESCACIALLQFMRRMQLLENDVIYADIIEKVMYNNLLSSVSLDGSSFFYVNPLEIDLDEFKVNSTTKKRERELPLTQRQKVFGCSCCPPNITRQIASIGNVAFTESSDAIYVQQFIGCTLERPTDKIQITTNYPSCGKVDIKVDAISKECLGIRIPSWCKNFTLKINGALSSEKPILGCLKLKIANGTQIELNLEMKPEYLFSNPLCKENIGKTALSLGPVIYCLEGVDNGNIHPLAASLKGKVELGDSSLCGIPTLIADGYKLKMDGAYSSHQPEQETIQLKFIPYFAFANRGESDMRVWVPYKE